MRLPWQKINEEDYNKIFEDKTKEGPYDNEYVVLKNVNKIYDNKFHAVHDFNLTIHKNEFIVFVGPSGCGKSTTLRMIAGLEDISTGELYINGEYSNDLLSRDRDIAMVFQNYALYPNMSVYKNMAFALQVRHFSKDIVKKRVLEAAKILEIEDQLNKKPKELSGGQRQRVALGRAIVRNARIFLMDEPLSNLDAKLRVQMRSEIIRLHRQLKATTIYVTHDQTEAMTMADRIVVMKSGFVQQIGTPIEIYREPKNLFVASFIGSPAMNLLKGTYKKGVVKFTNGDKYCLPDELVKKHDKYYREQLIKEERLYPEYLAKLEEEKNTFYRKKHSKKDCDEFDTKYKEFIENKDKLKVTLNDIVHGAEHEIIFGIRPEDIKECKPNDKDAMKVEIKLSELLGDQYYLHFDYGNKDVLSKIETEELVESGVKMNLKINPKKIHLFDSLTEESI